MTNQIDWSHLSEQLLCKGRREGRRSVFFCQNILCALTFLYFSLATHSPNPFPPPINLLQTKTFQLRPLYPLLLYHVLFLLLVLIRVLFSLILFKRRPIPTSSSYRSSNEPRQPVPYCTAPNRLPSASPKFSNLNAYRPRRVRLLHHHVPGWVLLRTPP